jgi:hypothetical protein
MRVLNFAAAAATLFIGALSLQPAHAADTKAPTPQQQRMAACNKEAGEKALKGDERQAFMKECLSHKPGDAQRDRMKSCNAEASEKALKGDERKAFMSQCLKKS